MTSKKQSKIELIDKNMRYSLHSETFAYLANNPYEEFYEAEIKRATKLSTGGVNKALKDLTESELVLRREIGKFRLYKFNTENPIARQYKALLNIRQIWLFVRENIIKKSDKVVLFGSASRGENLPESDIDLFIMSSRSKEIEQIIDNSKWAEKIQPIIIAPGEMGNIDKKLSTEIDKGVVLWERQSD